MRRPLVLAALSAVSLAGPATPAGAQGSRRDTALAAPGDTVRDRTPGLPAATRAGNRLAGVAATGGLILLGAAGAQALHTPAAWPRTASGFGRRVADQTGFYVAQAASQRAIAAGLGWHGDERPCPRRAVLPLAGCAVARTFTTVDRGGARRAPVPFLASVAAATAASVLWRPERRSAAETRAFAATRLGVVFAGFAGERLLAEWRRGRDRVE